MGKRRILVTGGAGFIGSWLIRHLLSSRDDISVTNLDLLAYAGNLENLTSVEKLPNYRFVHGDIRDEALVASLMRETDICINVAAQTHVDRSITGPNVFASTNILGTQVLLEAGRQAEISKFIQISTDEVYGSLGPTGLFSETTPLDPSSPYSASKASADLMALSYFRTYGFPVCITRCSNNYGPNQYPEKLIPLFILNALDDKPVPVYGDGLNVRDWIHVRDHNAAVALVMEKGRPGQIYNIGASNEQANLDITRKILALTGKSDALIQYVTDRLGHDRRYAIDSSKLQNELGWRPTIGFDEGLRETVQWYQENREWVRHIREREAAAFSG